MIGEIIYKTFILFFPWFVSVAKAFPWMPGSAEFPPGRGRMMQAPRPEYCYGTRMMQMSFLVLADLIYNLKNTPGLFHPSFYFCGKIISEIYNIYREVILGRQIITVKYK